MSDVDDKLLLFHASYISSKKERFGRNHLTLTPLAFIRPNPYIVRGHTMSSHSSRTHGSIASFTWS